MSQLKLDNFECISLCLHAARNSVMWAFILHAELCFTYFLLWKRKQKLFKTFKTILFTCDSSEGSTFCVDRRVRSDAEG